MTMTKADLFSLLEEKYNLYNQPGFIENDPIAIPHQFKLKQDIEIAGFLAATISWGNRKSIVTNAFNLVRLMDESPYDFLVNAKPREFKPFLRFVYRTFNGEDCLFFISSLQHIFRTYQSMEPLFNTMNDHGAAHAISRFREVFLSTEHLNRSEKHLANPLAGSAAKRINMFLRWMVRHDDRGVDFGLWQSIKPAGLACPLDIHVGRVARDLGLLCRQQNDWRAVLELTDTLRSFDHHDPVKYDYALFGMGINNFH